jgi:hypothetical protein
MPVERATVDGQPGYRWGQTGTVYTYTTGSATSRARAYASAARQGVAARASGYEPARTFIPPAAVAAVARRALDERAQRPPSERGMTAVGIARARDLSTRRPVSLDTIRRMDSYFARHEVDKQGATWATYGAGRQAWDGWGGDLGRSWVAAILRTLTQKPS